MRAYEATKCDEGGSRGAASPDMPGPVRQSSIDGGLLISLDCPFFSFARRYDFSPIMVRLIETRRSFLYFLTSVCAILGGVFALSGIIDTIFHRAAEATKKK